MLICAWGNGCGSEHKLKYAAGATGISIISGLRGRSALHAAAETSHVEMVRWLLGAGADPKARTVAGQTVFLVAVPHASRDLLEILWEAEGGEDLLHADVQGVTPLHVAALHAEDATVQWCIDHVSAAQLGQAAPIRFADLVMALCHRETGLLADCWQNVRGRMRTESWRLGFCRR